MMYTSRIHLPSNWVLAQVFARSYLDYLEAEHEGPVFGQLQVLPTFDVRQGFPASQ